MSTIESESQWHGIRTPFKIYGAPVRIHWTFIASLLFHVFMAFAYSRSLTLLYFQSIMHGPVLFLISYVVSSKLNLLDQGDTIGASHFLIPNMGTTMSLLIFMKA
jgi:hypothetical protein